MFEDIKKFFRQKEWYLDRKVIFAGITAVVILVLVATV